MITVREAQGMIEDAVSGPQKETRPVTSSLGYVLAEEVRAPFSLPLADNSAMDGFVLRTKDVAGASAAKPVRLCLGRDIRAGDSRIKRLKPGCAHRIMTGALIPRGGGTVLIKERSLVRNGYLVVTGPLETGRNIRRGGEEIKRGAAILKKNSIIHAGTVGILSSVGRKKVTVYRKPRVALIATGSELIEPGRLLRPGKIYNSNSKMLAAGLENAGIVAFSSETAKDSPQALKRSIARSLKRADVLILMGGVSVGDYDFVKDVVKHLGILTVFWRVSQKPGNPLYFGRKGRTLIFGLPGNPASVFTCFYEYVYPALRKLAGHRNPYLRREQATLTTAVMADTKRFLFLKGKIETRGRNKIAIPLTHQQSHMISSLQEANSLILIPPQKKRVKKGEQVYADLLP